jgi:hypothetical protein
MVIEEMNHLFEPPDRHELRTPLKGLEPSGAEQTVEVD